MIQDEDERLLVLLVQSGDTAAFEKLLIRIYKPLCSYLGKLAGESMVEDILQETSLQIYRQIRFLREPKALRAWVYRIATRIAFVHLSRARRWREIETDPVAIKGLLTNSDLEEFEFESDLLNLVDRVSPASRAVLLLHYQQHLSLEETAAILGIPLGTAKSRLSYGVATLRKFIKEKERR